MVWERPVTCKCNRSPSWPLFQLLDCFQELQNLWETVTFRCNRSLANLKKQQVFLRFKRRLACEYVHRHNSKQISRKNVWWRRPVTLRCNRSPQTAKSQKTQASSWKTMKIHENRWNLSKKSKTLIKNNENWWIIMKIYKNLTRIHEDRLKTDENLWTRGMG